jgi:hypothetical protein
METHLSRFDRLDLSLTRWMADHGITLLRISLGIVFLWFGALKFFPGLSPAQELAGRTIQTLTFGLLAPDTAVLILAVWECLIGLGLLLGVFLRATLLLGDHHAAVPVPAGGLHAVPDCPDPGRAVHHQEPGTDQRRHRHRGHGARGRALTAARPGCGSAGVAWAKCQLSGGVPPGRMRLNQA